MPSYPPPSKHIVTLRASERRLKAAMARDDARRLDVCVERVRRARLIILKTRRESLKYEPETLERDRELRRIRADEDLWGSLSIAEISQYYQ